MQRGSERRPGPSCSRQSWRENPAPSSTRLHTAWTAGDLGSSPWDRQVPSPLGICFVIWKQREPFGGPRPAPQEPPGRPGCLGARPPPPARHGPSLVHPALMKGRCEPRGSWLETEPTQPATKGKASLGPATRAPGAGDDRRRRRGSAPCAQGRGRARAGRAAKSPGAHPAPTAPEVVDRE